MFKQTPRRSKALFRVPMRAHNGLVLMTALAVAYPTKTPVSLENVAAAEGLSQGFLEDIANDLRRAKLITGRRGKGGGYVLAKPPKKMTVRAVLEAVEGPIALVDCLASGIVCPSGHRCASRRIWKKVQDRISSSLGSVTLADLT
ncbi:Rrf2 family transcriptional regulator [Candidatus Uhrbacteria bacterium]|nr:Rrf2 family transcriptional regulator [Candidatus Uhrbacteria bacterium]